MYIDNRAANSICGEDMGVCDVPNVGIVDIIRIVPHLVFMLSLLVRLGETPHGEAVPRTRANVWSVVTLEYVVQYVPDHTRRS